MFNFDFKKTTVFQSMKREKNPLLRFSGFFYRLSFYLFVIFFFLFSFLFSSGGEGVSFFFGLSVLFLMSTLFFWQLNLFFKSEIKEPEQKISLEEALLQIEKYNLAEFFDLDTAKSVWRATKFCEKRKTFNVFSTVLFYFLLKDDEKARSVFLRLGLDIISFQERIKNYIENNKKRTDDEFPREFQNVIKKSLEIAQKRNHHSIKVKDVLVGLAKQDPFFKNFLLKSEDFKEEDIQNITRWMDYFDRIKEEEKKFWKYENLLKKGSIGRDWAAGYTVTLDDFSIDWRKVVKKWTFKEIIGHGKEIEKIERTLTRSTINNVLLVGQPGTGRKSIIKSLAQRIYHGRSSQDLNYKRVVELDLVSLLSQIEDPEKVESTLDRIFGEVINAGNVILVINEFHKYVSVEGFQPGAVDISGIISRYLQYPQFRLIAMVTYEGLHKKIEQNSSLLELFEKVEVSELSGLETMRVLENLTLELENKHNLFVTYPAKRAIVNLTDRYIPSAPFPKKAIDVLEEVVSYVSNLKDESVVSPEHVEKVLSEKIETPVGVAKSKEKKILLNLEKLIHERIVNQEEAVKEISTALRRARADLSSQKKPMGTFLFLGSTGVGKTETAKALAEIYFKGEKNMIRLDMSEFQEISDIERLIGSLGKEGLLTTPVRENPFSLILLDEIEKAHPNILNIFLQVFDEGHITDGQGRKTAFTNSIIICTSNAGSEIIWKDVEETRELNMIKEDLLSHFFEEKIFRPEFINRFDALVVFTPLTKGNLLKISQLLLSSLKDNLQEKGIELEITEQLKEKIVDLGYDPSFGAREMRRVIQDKVGNVLAQALLSDKVKRGDRIKINSENFELIINEEK